MKGEFEDKKRRGRPKVLNTPVKIVLMKVRYKLGDLTRKYSHSLTLGRKGGNATPQEISEFSPRTVAVRSSLARILSQVE